MYNFSLMQTGATPFYIASQNGHSDVVSFLIKKGADTSLASQASSTKGNPFNGLVI